MEDSRIIELYWARDEGAIPATAEKYGLFCRRIARSVLEDERDAEECVNDTYHRTWTTIPPQRPKSLSAYLGRIVKNLSIDRYRRERAQKRFNRLDVSLSELEECIPGQSGPEERLELEQLTQSINGFLGSLSKQRRILFLRRYWHGQTVEEIARDYGRSKSGVYATLSALRGELREYLAGEGFIL